MAVRVQIVSGTVPWAGRLGSGSCLRDPGTWDMVGPPGTGDCAPMPLCGTWRGAVLVFCNGKEDGGGYVRRVPCRQAGGWRRLDFTCPRAAEG